MGLTVADLFGEQPKDPGSLSLRDGSRIAVMGSGTAGALYSYFVLEMAERIGLEIEVHIYEPKDFDHRGPRGCNMCGGIVSESLVQTLAADGINLPSSVVQRGIEAYILHTDAGTVRIATPVGEKRIAAVHRGAGPLKAPEAEWKSFDGFLNGLARKKGAKVIPEAITGISWDNGLPHISSASTDAEPYDLLVVSCGINGPALKMFERPSLQYRPPRLTRTMIREYYMGARETSDRFGDAMHLFLLNIPRLEFAAIVPKGECATLVMLGDKIDTRLLQSFQEAETVRAQLGDRNDEANACGCSPKIAVTAARHPFGDRLVFIGDCGVTRLYKDGIGASYRTAKAAATTTVFKGISESDFEKDFYPACRAINIDNQFGRIVFMVTSLIQKSRVAQRAVLRMVDAEQNNNNLADRMSSVLWDTFTGSAPYRDVFVRTLHPVFILRLVGNLIAAALPFVSRPVKNNDPKVTKEN